MTINKTTPVDDATQLVSVTITHGSDSYGYEANTPVLEGDELQAHCDANEFKWLNNILYQVYGRNIQFGTLDEWDEWIAAGCKLEEISETITTPAVEAKPAVMGERQKVLDKEVEEEVSKTEVVLIDGKYVEQTTTETVTKTVSEPQFTEHPLYNEDGTPQMRVVTEAKDAILDDDGAELEPAVEEVTEPVLHSVPLMENFEIEPAIKAVKESSETIIVRPETVVEKVAWKDTAE